MEVLKIISNNPSLIIEKSARLIKKGGVVIFPTDTLYGLLADARNKMAVKKVFKIKKRRESKAVPVFVRNIGAARKLAFISKNQEKILKKSWPGRVTFVLKRRNNQSKIFSSE